MFAPRRHNDGGFVVLVAACWLLGVVGLSGSGRWPLAITLAAGAALFAKLVGRVRRRRAEFVLERRAWHPGAQPPSCVVVRWLGERSDRLHRAGAR